MGYAGGTKKAPTYHDLGDHTESIQIDFDPTQITYAEIVDLFWQWHNPCGRAASRQYRAVLFVQNEGQRKVALESKGRIERERGRVTTEVLDLTGFWLAEDYHQKYYLRQEPTLLGELLAVYPDGRDFTNSTAAARLNAWVAGHVPAGGVEREVGTLGLSESTQKIVRERFGG